jgi:acyl-CoA synthetase (AMP-forming)/AMP-acid ligase II
LTRNIAVFAPVHISKSPPLCRDIPLIICVLGAPIRIATRFVASVCCAVFGVPHAEFGQSLVAVIQPTDNIALTVEQVRSFLAAKIAGFKIPRTILFRAALPREDTGKIFKRRLRDEFLSSSADAGHQ